MDAKAFRDDGFAVLKGLIRPNEIEPIRAAIADAVDRLVEDGKLSSDSKIRR